MAGTGDAPQVLRLRRRVRRTRFAQETYQRPTYNPPRACAVIMLGVPAVVLLSCVLICGGIALSDAIAGVLSPFER